MATIPSTPASTEVDYPTGDGKPVGETPIHRDNLLYTVFLLGQHFAADPLTYVSGNMFLYYVRGDKRRHVSPDVFVVRGISHRYRKAYFTWEEGGRGPDFVVEMTSASTRNEDMKHKFALYRDVLRVREYFLFDPEAEYLNPPLQGYRLIHDQYEPIEPLAGRLPSEVVGLHLEAAGDRLRLFDPARGRWITDPSEYGTVLEQTEAERDEAEAERAQAEARSALAEAARKQAEAERRRLASALKRAEADRQRIEAESERLRAELEALRRQLPGE